MSTEAALGALAPVVARKRAEVDGLRRRSDALWARAATAPARRDFVAALHGGAVIAEMKRRSPSGGALRGDLDPAATAVAYAGAGAAAVSVLTDGPDFGGSLDDLAAARAAVPLPVLCKDFTVDPLQVAQARAAGADAVLLIVAVLGAAGLEECLAAAARAGLDALVEVHDAAEAKLAADGGAALVGVNNRDLRSLHTDLGTFARLRGLLPAGITVIAESGVHTPTDCARLVADGADAVLVGEALMRADSPGALCAEMVAAGRSARYR
ncbi:MAG TPA: indole-3-glycerol phosphate synthase TrpC [Candidatus Dormibacteraeota bacterium]